MNRVAIVFLGLVSLACSGCASGRMAAARNRSGRPADTSGAVIGGTASGVGTGAGTMTASPGTGTGPAATHPDSSSEKSPK